MSSINLDNPYLLLLVIPLIALFAVPFGIAIRKDNVNAHNVTSGIIHVLLAVIIAVTAAGTSIVTTVTQTDVYVLADVSYSANKNLDTIDTYINNLSKSLPDNSRMGIICFGKDYNLITRLGGKINSVKDSGVDDTATDIVGAMEYAGSLFRADVIKRIVLITDGKETNQSDPNALKRVADSLADRKIHVDAIYLDDNMKGDAKEVQLSAVELTQVASLNRKESAIVTVQVNCPDSKTENGVISPYSVDVVFSLKKDGEEYVKRQEELFKGLNYVSIDLPTDEAGVFDYELTVDWKEDENKLNNTIAFTQTVSGDLNVLLLTSDENEIDEVQKMYGANATIDAYTYLQDPLLPRSVDALCLYDEIVISDVDITEMANYELFLSSLDTVVSLFGKSLVTFGNTYIQTHPKGELDKLSRMLPVTYGRSENDKRLYMLVVDTSRSMEQTGGANDARVAVAKRASLKIVDMLSNNDSVGLITFDGQAHRTIAPITLGTGREEIVDAINNFELKNGTSIGSGLEEALNNMKGRPYGEMRVMLITDGLNYDTSASSSKVLEVVQEMRDYRIYTSVLDVGRAGASGSGATAAYNLLNNIAERGGGKYMDISNDDNIDRVLNSQLPSEVNKPDGGWSDVHVKKRNDAVLKNGITEGNPTLNEKLGVAYVRNYIYSQARGGVTPVLTVTYEGGSKPVECPLYAYWNYGNGRVAAFTSAMTGEWTSSIDTALREKLFENIMQTNTPKEKNYFPFLLDLFSHDGYVDVTLTPETVRATAEATISIKSPDGTVAEGALAFGSSTFDFSFVTLQTGKYEVTVNYSYGGRDYSVTRYLSVSYSAEYDSFALYDSAGLHKMLGANGKVSEDGKLELVNDASEIGLYNLPLTLPLLVVAVALFVIDIAVRKLKWEDIQSLFKKVNRGKQ